MLLPSTLATEFGGAVHRATPVVQGRFFDDVQARGALRWIRLSGDWLTRRGLDQVAIVNFAPPAARHRAATAAASLATMPLPDDLLALYWHGRTNLPGQTGVRQAWEVWNEPDFHFVGDNPDRMAAVLKAAWWGIKAGNPAATVLMPSLAFPPGQYLDELVRNRIGPYTDGYNFHHYGWAQDFLPHLRAHRAAMARAGWELPVWITESGHVEMLAQVAPRYEELARQQAYHERVALSAFAAGVDYYLAFILDPFVEGNFDLGMSDPDGEPRPALDSYLHLTRALPATKPRYWIRHRATASEVGVVLQESADTWWVALWSPYRHDDLLLPAPTDRGERDGRGRRIARQPRTAGRWGGEAKLPAWPEHGAVQLTALPRRSRLENAGSRSRDVAEGRAVSDSLGQAASTELPLALRFDPPAAAIRIGLRGEALLEEVADARFEVEAGANLHLRVPARRFELAGCDWVPIAPPAVAKRRPPPAVGLDAPGPGQRAAGPGRPGAPSPVIIQVDYLPDSFTADKPSRSYRYVPALPLRAVVTLYNFTEVPCAGDLQVRLPPGWSGQWEARAGPGPAANGVLPPPGRAGERAENLRVPPLGKVILGLTLHPRPEAGAEAVGPGRPSARIGMRPDLARSGAAPGRSRRIHGRDLLELRWTDGVGREDIHAVWLEEARPAWTSARALPASSWVNRVHHPDRWEIRPVEDDVVRLVLRKRPPRGTSLSVLYAFPSELRWRAEDEFELAIRVGAGATNVLWRPFLFTDDQQVLRYRDFERLDQGWTTLRARCGDFTRSLWSRIPASRTPDLGRIRFLSLEFTALEPGDWVEVRVTRP